MKADCFWNVFDDLYIRIAVAKDVNIDCASDLVQQQRKVAHAYYQEYANI